MPLKPDHGLHFSLPKSSRTEVWVGLRLSGEFHPVTGGASLLQWYGQIVAWLQMEGHALILLNINEHAQRARFVCQELERRINNISGFITDTLDEN
jgi:hypothetical protein